MSEDVVEIVGITRGGGGGAVAGDGIGWRRSH